MQDEVIGELVSVACDAELMRCAECEARLGVTSSLASGITLLSSLFVLCNRGVPPIALLGAFASNLFLLSSALRSLRIWNLAQERWLVWARHLRSSSELLQPPVREPVAPQVALQFGTIFALLALVVCVKVLDQ